MATYFLTKPEEIDRRVSELAGYLNASYFGFTKISDEKLAAIAAEYGSVEEFVDREFGRTGDCNAPALEAVLSWIRNLRTQASPDGRFHYKPLLLLALLDVLDAYPGHPNSFGYEEMLAAFEGLAAELGSSVTEDRFSQPYLRLRNDASPLRVWIPQIDGAEEVDDSRADRPAYVRTRAPSARIDDSVWPCFSSPDGRAAIRQEIDKVWALKGRDERAPWFGPLLRPPGLEAELRLILERSNRRDQDLLAAIFRRAILLHQRHETEGFLGAQRKLLRRFSITIGNVYACAVASNGRDTLYLLVDDDATLRQTYEVGEAPFSSNELMWLHGRLDRDSLQGLLEDEAVWDAYGRMLRKVTNFSSARSNQNNRGKLSVLSGKPYEPGSHKQKQVWLFQANPKQWDLVQELQTVRPGDEDDWTVTRYREEMRPGDRVVLWQGGSDAGVYALGELVGEPFERELPPWRPPKNDGSETEWAIGFRYERILQSPIPKEILLENPDLRGLQVLRAPQGTNFKVTEQEWKALEALLNGGPEPPNARKTLDDLADELLVEKAFLEKVVRLLRDKGQVIFYGPPGTGKTFVARKLIEHLAPETHRREVVQFHPSYSYEDFVQGYRPAIRSDGTLNYDLKPGPFMRLAARAKTTPGEHVLLVDEINRGNLPKILGELLYLLEYREDEVALMYSEGDARFSLPEGLLIVGTMNTADRSIALIDAALRRRFHFVPFFPDEWPLKGLLLRWLERHRPEMVGVAHIVDRLNALLRERFGPHLQVGPSHFMKEDLDEAVLRRVWDYDMMPFLEDQLFGQEEELERFRLEKLRGADDADHNAEGTPAEPRTPDEE